MSSASDRRRCAHCEEQLRDEAVLACGRLWHPQHFTCVQCNTPIKQVYQEKNNAHYCTACFAEQFNPRCAGCGETLRETCVSAMDKHWHQTCFVCTLCRQPFPQGEYYVVDDAAYDLDCHWGRRLDKHDQVQRHHK